MDGSEAAAGLSPNAGRYNLRDYGGYARIGGGRLRSGCLFRSGQFDNALPEDSGLLSRLGVGSIIDLRSGVEVGSSLSVAYDGFDGDILTAASEDGSIPHALKALVRLMTPDQVAAHMIDTYRALPVSTRFRQSMGLYFRSLANGEGANLVHCFAGKDRTGLAVALFHLILGVHPDDAFDDYLRTNAMGEERISSGMAALRAQADVVVTDSVLREAMGVRTEYLAAALDLISTECESPAAFVMAAAGLEEQDLERIVARYVA